MIRSFLDSWELFGNTWIVGWLVAVLLSLVGIAVVARDQIFVGAAVSQASTLGVSLGLALHAWIPGWVWLEDPDSYTVLAVLFAMGAAALTARGVGPTRGAHESLTGWVFLFCSSSSILVISHSPHGTEEIHRLLASSLLTATEGDRWRFVVLIALTAVALWGLGHRIVLEAIDPTFSRATGSPRWLGVALLAWLGLAVGLSIRVAGMLYSFGCLVLPALSARNLCREVRQLVVVTPALALIGAVIGFAIGNHVDDPPATTAVGALCVIWVATLPVRRWHRRR